MIQARTPAMQAIADEITVDRLWAPGSIIPASLAGLEITGVYATQDQIMFDLAAPLASPRTVRLRELSIPSIPILPKPTFRYSDFSALIGCTWESLEIGFVDCTPWNGPNGAFVALFLCRLGALRPSGADEFHEWYLIVPQSDTALFAWGLSIMPVLPLLTLS